ncbi:MAG: hypothetical protein DRJ47_10900, partial [Thermoprotei archaeon]
SEDPAEARKLLDKIPCLFITITNYGLIGLDAGVDFSNLPPGYAIANIVDFDEAAKEIRDGIERITGKRVAVVISDTETNISGKFGSIDVAVGCSGIKPITGRFAAKDIYGKPKFGGVDIIVDELASTAALLMGQTSERVPVVIVKGLKYDVSEEGVKDYLMGFRGLRMGFLLKNFLARIILRFAGK